jgi:HK97 family phage major capsid protein
METRDSLLRRAQAIALKPNLTTADRAEFDNVIARVDAMDTRSASAFGGFTARHLDCPEARNFERYVRYGERSEQRDLGTTLAVGAGNQFVPQAFYPVLTEAKKAWGKVIEAVNERPTDTGAPMKIAFSNDTGNLAGVVGETGLISEVDPSLNSTLLNTDECSTGIVKVSIAELQDSAFDIDKFIRDIFGKRYFRGLTSLITNGSGSGNIGSIVSGAYSAVTSLYDNGIAYEDLTAMYGALDPDYLETASWVMKSTSKALLLGVKDGFGRPLYVPNPNGAAFDSLLGCPIVLDQYMDGVQPSTSSPAYTNIPLLFGDLKQGYLLRTVKPGLAIARLNERYMDTLEVGFIGYFRAGGIVTDAGTHPIISLLQNSTGSMPSSD